MNLTPEWVTAWATAVLAFFAIVSAVGLAITLRHNSRLARASVTLARLQWLSAFPRLRPSRAGMDISPTFLNAVAVERIGGTLAAHDIDVWGSLHSGHFFNGHIPQLAPTDDHVAASMALVTDRRSVPFNDVPDLAENDWWVGIRWRGPGDRQGLSSWVFRAKDNKLVLISERLPDP